jgi:serine phosphatase RsbU (regulator of sigma subunit)
LSTQSFLEDYWTIIRQTIMFFIVAQVPGVFGILAAAIYSQMGFFAFLFFLCAGFLISAMARRLSQAVILSQQKSGELDQLEQLGRAIIVSPADTSELSGLLAEYVPKMLTYHQIEIRLFNNRILLQLPEDRPPVNDRIWPWLADNPQHHEFDSGKILPWSDERSVNHLVITPIFSTEQELIGGICLVEDSTYMGNITTDLQPALQVLAAQIASALHGAEVFAQTLDHQRVSQELAFGGQIQASFLPEELPTVEGWQLAAMLLPAKETSGDFYDLTPLSNGRLAIVVADVADKGVGAALFMALSRTLLRTYAMEYETGPGRVLAAANRRIMSDARADLFVTTFYGILNPTNGEFTYANAGHNPPYLVSNRTEDSVYSLKKTGIALGLLEENEWKQNSILIPPGGTLVLYSDGVTDAQNLEGEFFGEERLMAIIQANLGKPAGEMQEIISSAVEEFVGEASQFDDITLVVLVRET